MDELIARGDLAGGWVLRLASTHPESDMAWAIDGHDATQPATRDNPRVECESCRSLAGELVLTTAPRLDLDEYWRVEHCHPVAVAGWLVLVLRRHARALHDLDDDEATALGKWLPILTRALHDATGCELEYVMQFAEGAGFHHVHFHLVARSSDWSSELTGPGVFGAFGVPDPIAPEAATRIIDCVSRYIGVPTTPLIA